MYTSVGVKYEAGFDQAAAASRHRINLFSSRLNGTQKRWLTGTLLEEEKAPMRHQRRTGGGRLRAEKKTRPHIVKSGFSAVSLGNILKSTCENIPDIELCFASYILKLWTRQKLLEVALYWSSHSHRIPVQSRLWQINDPVGEIKNRTLKHKQEI